MFETVNETELMKLIQRFSHVTVASEALPMGSDVTALRRFVFSHRRRYEAFDSFCDWGPLLKSISIFFILWDNDDQTDKSIIYRL